MGRRIFRRPYLFMRHRARRMERRMARAVSHGSMVGAGTGAVTGAMLSGNGSSRSNPQKDKRTFHEATLLPVLEIVLVLLSVLS